MAMMTGLKTGPEILAPLEGLCWVYLTSSPVIVNFDALEWLWTHFKTEPIAPQEKGAKNFFLSKIGHSVSVIIANINILMLIFNKYFDS